MDRPNLIYIASTGHSGSTLLDILLSNYSDMIFSTGEIVYFTSALKRSLISTPTIENGIACSCLKSYFDCDIWSKIMENISKVTGVDLHAKPEDFRVSIINNTHYPGTNLRIKAFKHLLFMEEYLPLKPFQTITREIYKKRIENNWTLFSAISEVTKKPYVVDSTKDILRFVYLNNANPGKTHLIVLIRDAFGVAASSKRRKGADPVLVAKKWLKYYKILHKMIDNRKIINFSIAKYEDLVTHTVSNLNTIYKSLGLQEIHSIWNQPVIKIKNNHHLVGGNGMRYKKEFEVKGDESWKEVLTREEASQIEIINDQNPFYPISDRDHLSNT
jgi:hypothetical protein